MPTKFPGPYVNDTKVDTSIMHYVRDGGFEHTDIGSRKSGMPGSIKNGMGIDHVGAATPGSVSSKFPS